MACWSHPQPSKEQKQARSQKYWENLRAILPLWPQTCGLTVRVSNSHLQTYTAKHTTIYERTDCQPLVRGTWRAQEVILVWGLLSAADLLKLYLCWRDRTIIIAYYSKNIKQNKHAESLWTHKTLDEMMVKTKQCSRKKYISLKMRNSM